MKRKILLALLAALLGLPCLAQFSVTSHQEGWENYPPEAVRRGYYFQKSVLFQMDDDPQMEEVIGRDNGHWPEFDLFKFYYVIVDAYTHEIQYTSEGEYVTDHYELIVEDRNKDGKGELYVNYIKDGTFQVDERGYHMRAVRCHDRIEFTPQQKKR